MWVMNESPFFGAKTPGKYWETGNIFLSHYLMIIKIGFINDDEVVRM